MFQTKRRLWFSILIIGLTFIILLGLGTCTDGLLSPLPYRYLDTFSGKVIDAVSKKPIQGAVILAVYYKESLSIAGSNSFVVDGQETLSDDQGEFLIPRKIRLFPLFRGYTEGNLIIFKPGYGAFPKHKMSTAVGVNKSWPPPKKYIVYELPKLESLQARVKTVLGLRVKYDLQFSKQTIIIEKINNEFKYLGINDRYIEEDGKPIRTIER